MNRSQGLRRSTKAHHLRLEKLDDRTLLSPTTCTLTQGVLETTFCNDQDVVEVDAQPATQAIAVLINNQPAFFPAADVQALRVSQLHANDVVLLDTNLRLPLLLDGTIQGNEINGWVRISPQSVVHQHNSGSGLFHWIIDNYNYQTGWSILPVPGGTSDGQASSTSGTSENQSSRLAASLSLASFATANLSIASLLGGHLFHYLNSTPSTVLASTSGMTSSHEDSSSQASSEMRSSLGGAAHEVLTNPPTTMVEPKPG